MLHAEEIRKNHQSLLAEFSALFPTITPPDNHWFALWLQRYPFVDIREAIITLSKHHLKDRFTTESCGRAISALLRQSAVRRAMTPSAASSVFSVNGPNEIQGVHSDHPSGESVQGVHSEHADGGGVK